MKSVILDERGYTADGEWRLVPIESTLPMDIAGNSCDGHIDEKFGVMVKAAPAPELPDAKPIGRFTPTAPSAVQWNEGLVRGDFPEGTLIFAAPPAPAIPADAHKLIAQGRAEAMALLMKISPDCMDDYIDGIGGNGDQGLSWNYGKLKALFKIEEDAWNLVSAADEKASYWFSALHELVCEAKQGLCPPELCGYGKGQSCCQESKIEAIKEAERLLDQPLNSTEKDKRIAELEARNQALRADAERYRFMRVKSCIISGVFHILNMPSAGDGWRQKYDAAEQLDAAIDAAKGVSRG